MGYPFAATAIRIKYYCLEKLSIFESVRIKAIGIAYVDNSVQFLNTSVLHHRLLIWCHVLVSHFKKAREPSVNLTLSSLDRRRSSLRMAFIAVTPPILCSSSPSIRPSPMLCSIEDQPRQSRFPLGWDVHRL